MFSQEAFGDFDEEANLFLAIYDSRMRQSGRQDAPNHVDDLLRLQLLKEVEGGDVKTTR